MPACRGWWLGSVVGLLSSLLWLAPSFAQEKAIVGLIPKAPAAITLDGKLDDWQGAFVTPVHVGHPDFANRGGQFLFLWDEQNLYIGLRCLDQKPAHVAADNRIYDGDAVEFYLDTRQGDQLGAAPFGPGTLHMFWTPFTGTEVKPRLQVRELPVFRAFKLRGAEVAAEKTSWGYTAEFKLPWANFPNLVPKAGAVIGIDCELCSSDGGARVDRTFVYSSPQSVSTPASFGRVRLVEKLEPSALGPFGRVLLPLGLTKSANYAWLYGNVCVSPSIEDSVAKLEGKIIDQNGKVRKTTTGSRRKWDGFDMWNGSWELFDLPSGTYTLDLAALDKENKAITSRTVSFVHSGSVTPRAAQNPSPMVENTRSHLRLTEEKPSGRREKLAVGTLFLPGKLRPENKVLLFIHFHGGTWLPEVAASRLDQAAVISVQLGSGSSVYSREFANGEKFGQILKEAETKAGFHFDLIGLSAWSAGYGAIREILKVPENYERIRFVLLIDGLHAGYATGKPGPRGSQLVSEDLDVFLRFARDAVAGKRQMILTHSEIFPGTFASTTETADYLLQQLGLTRQATLVWGPMKTQQLSEAERGKFRLLGYAGNTAPDHVDQLHSLPEYLKWIERP